MIISTIYFNKNRSNKFFLFFLFLIQKVDIEVIDKKAEIINILKISKQLISLYSNEIKDLSSYEYHFQDMEEDIEDEDENDLDYLETLHFNLVQQFKNFLIECNIDYRLKIQQPIIKKKSTINNLEKPIINKDHSTFTRTPEWLRLKISILSPNNKTINAFNAQLHFLCIINKFEKIFVRHLKSGLISTILIGKTLFFHYRNKIIKRFK